MRRVSVINRYLVHLRVRVSVNCKSFLDVNRAESSSVEMAVAALIRIISGAEAESSAMATAERETTRIIPRIL